MFRFLLFFCDEMPPFFREIIFKKKKLREIDFTKKSAPFFATYTRPKIAQQLLLPTPLITT